MRTSPALRPPARSVRAQRSASGALSRNEPPPPGSADSVCAAPTPSTRPGTLVGMSPEMTFTTPPRALLPYSSVAGPRTTSMRCAVSGSMVTAWSTAEPARSDERCPSCRMRMRSPVSPRMMGTAAAGPL
jgi:hypothetical protein